MNNTFDLYKKSNLILTPEDWEDYELIDSGSGQKLERFGKFFFVRPEAQALFPKDNKIKHWAYNDGVFLSSGGDEGGKWKLKKTLPEKWEIRYDGLLFNAFPTPFRHLGFFPEQAVHWRWCKKLINKKPFSRKPKILNLFGYSGIASLHAAKLGAEVTHVDASKKAIKMAFENRDLSKLNNAPIRFIVDDALSFAKREVRREIKYDGIILDPPKYGRGPKGEKWNIDTDLPLLLNEVRKLLSKDLLFIVLNAYAIRSSHLALLNSLAISTNINSGFFSSGELAIEQKNSAKKLSCSIFVRWGHLDF